MEQLGVRMRSLILQKIRDFKQDMEQREKNHQLSRIVKKKYVRDWEPATSPSSYNTIYDI